MSYLGNEEVHYRRIWSADKSRLSTASLGNTCQVAVIGNRISIELKFPTQWAFFKDVVPYTSSIKIVFR